jgi:hypothetical protein
MRFQKFFTFRPAKTSTSFQFMQGRCPPLRTGSTGCPARNVRTVSARRWRRYRHQRLVSGLSSHSVKVRCLHFRVLPSFFVRLVQVAPSLQQSGLVVLHAAAGVNHVLERLRKLYSGGCPVAFIFSVFCFIKPNKPFIFSFGVASGAFGCPISFSGFGSRSTSHKAHSAALQLPRNAIGCLLQHSM